MSDGKACVCPCCQHDVDFALDPFLVEELANNNVVVFAGAGVSTERTLSAPHSLYTALAVKLGLEDTTTAFPDVAEGLSKKPDGRFQLMRIIQEHLDYVEKFADTRYEATKFHREASTMPYLKTFITTNWDRSFEDICRAKPFVYDPDLRFWNVPNRKVLKIHGTIDDYSTIVATRRDYDVCAERLHKSLIGAKLKEILTNNTCVFVGYSMRDDDFLEIFRFVREAQGKFEKTHYFVSPNANIEENIDNIIPIATDGAYFLKCIKEHMCNNYCYLSDDILDLTEEELYDVIEEHEWLWSEHDPKEFPQILISATYQDGLIHGYKLVRDMKGSGEWSDGHLIQSKIKGYEDKVDFYRKEKNYFSAAYFRGFQNVLVSLAMALCDDELLCPPRFYHERLGEMDREEFVDRLMSLPEVHKTAYKQCMRKVSEWPDDEPIVLQHQPWG